MYNNEIDVTRGYGEIIPPGYPSCLSVFCLEGAVKTNKETSSFHESFGLTSGLINGTTPPCEMTTSPNSLFNLCNNQESSDSE